MKRWLAVALALVAGGCVTVVDEGPHAKRIREFAMRRCGIALDRDSTSDALPAPPVIVESATPGEGGWIRGDVSFGRNARDTVYVNTVTGQGYCGHRAWTGSGNVFKPF